MFEEKNEVPKDRKEKIPHASHYNEWLSYRLVEMGLFHYLAKPKS